MKTTAALAAASVLPDTGTGEAQYGRTEQTPPLPPHRPIPLAGVHAYTDRLSVAAGEVLRFHVSSTQPYRLEVCRLGADVDTPDQDEILHAWDVAAPAAQPIHPGSYIHIAEEQLADQELKALTLECWVRRWQTQGRQGILTQYDFPRACGFGLFLDADGSVGFYLGDGADFQDAFQHRTPAGRLSAPGKKEGDTVPAAGWHHLTATFNGTEKAVWIDGKQVGRWPAAIHARPGKAPLRIGALGLRGLADGFLDADVALPALHAVALTEAEIQRRFQERGRAIPRGDAVLACWPLTEEKGSRVADASRHGRHGRNINHATWMIGGPSFNAARDPYADYDPAKDADRGHGLRLASDDLVNCGWKPTHEYRIPEEAKSGIYVGRIRYERDGERRLYHTLFILKKAARRPQAPIAFLCSTNTWKAYAATPFCDTWPGLKQSIGNQGFQPSARDPAAYCFYRVHAAGQPAYHLGWKLPWPVVGPYTHQGDADYSHLCRSDRFSQVWLEQHGYAHDVITDLDLHQEPNMLNGYKVLFIVGHSEYWSFEAYEHVRRFLETGGSVVCLSGNTMYWRVSFDPEGSVIECRKVDGWGAQVPRERHAECWHSDDGRRGGVPRDCGFPAWQLLGLEFMTGIALTKATAGKIGPYRVVAADHALFRKPNPIAIRRGDLLGRTARDPQRQPIGHEVDALPTTLKANCPAPPDGRAHPQDPAGIVVLAEAIAQPADAHGRVWDYYHQPHAMTNDVVGQMIYWERPGGGRVYHAGSIAAGWALAVDPNWDALLRNVLAHFVVEPVRRVR